MTGLYFLEGGAGFELRGSHLLGSIPLEPCPQPFLLYSGVFGYGSCAFFHSGSDVDHNPLPPE
jgi:hypothetical protein